MLQANGDNDRSMVPNRERDLVQNDATIDDDDEGSPYFIGDVVEQDDEYDEHFVDRCEPLSNPSRTQSVGGDSTFEAFYSCRGNPSLAHDNGTDDDLEHGAVVPQHTTVGRTDVLKETNLLNTIFPSSFSRTPSNVSEDLSGAFHSCKEASSDETSSRLSAASSSFHTARDHSSFHTTTQDVSLAFTAKQEEQEETIRRSSHGSTIRSTSEFVTCHEASERSTVSENNEESFHTCHRLTKEGLKSALSKTMCENDNTKLNVPLHVFTNSIEDATEGGATRRHFSCDKRPTRLLWMVFLLVILIITAVTSILVLQQNDADGQPSASKEDEFVVPILLSDPPSSAPTPAKSAFAASGFRVISQSPTASPSPVP